MLKLPWSGRLSLGVALTAACIGTGSTQAAEPAAHSDRPTSATPSASIPLAQATRVVDLADVEPGDWAFQALRGLGQSYGCGPGDGDNQRSHPRENRPSRPLTRPEFASGLSACSAAMASGAAPAAADWATDWATLARLQEEFQAELAALPHRIDALEAATATLGGQQFSTTTTLEGEVTLNLGLPFDPIAVFDDDNDPEVVETSVSVAARARLIFDTSFTGDDRLRLRLQSRSGDFLDPFGGLADGGSGDYGVEFNELYYRFPLGDRLAITLSALGSQGSDWVSSTILPYDGPAVVGAAAPGFYQSGGSSGDGAGLGLSLELTDAWVLDAGYTAAHAGGAIDPAIGLFAAANQSAIAQLSYLGDGSLNAALVYMHSDQSAEFAGGRAGAVDTYAGLISLEFGDFFAAGHGAYQTFNGGTDVSWTVGLGMDNVFVEGAQLGIYGGQLPQLEDYANNPLLIEGYLTLPVTPFLTVTPALIYGQGNLQNTGGTRTDDTGLYGVIRATFEF